MFDSVKLWEAELSPREVMRKYNLSVQAKIRSDGTHFSLNDTRVKILSAFLRFTENTEKK